LTVPQQGIRLVYDWFKLGRNMRVGAYEAKTKLSALLDRVEAGEHVSITRYGRVVAVLSPPAGAADRTVEEAVSGMLDLRKGRRLGDDLTVRDLIDAGRR
jgi:prevent-host-death family protein